MKLPPAPKLLVFDLDGTLIDSRVDLCNSVNAMLTHYGKPPLQEPVIAGYIGDGVGTLVRRALAHAHLIPGLAESDQPDPHDNAFIEAAVWWFIQYYRIHKLDFTYVYPGVREALQQIRQRHPQLPMAVLTNKPVMPSRAICDELKLSPYFFQNYGGNSFASKKPAPEGLLALIAEAGRLTRTAIHPEEIVLIGDSHVDVETARAAGTAVLGCSFGLAPESLAAAGPDELCDSASDWPALLHLE